MSASEQQQPIVDETTYITSTEADKQHSGGGSLLCMTGGIGKAVMSYTHDRPDQKYSRPGEENWRQRLEDLKVEVDRHKLLVVVFPRESVQGGGRSDRKDQDSK